MLTNRPMCSALSPGVRVIGERMIEIPGQRNLWSLAGLYPGQCSVLELPSHEHGSATELPEAAPCASCGTNIE